MNLDDAIRSRKSVRQFLDKPVALAQVTDILSRANMAPIGTNVQPWHVHVVMGEKRAQLVAATLSHRKTDPADATAEFPRTSKRKEPYTIRMRTASV